MNKLLTPDLIKHSPCPLCGKEATSKHHIKPRADGGTDEPRNTVLLCKKCHDEVEGETLTPELIRKKRLEKLGRAVTGDEIYTFLANRPDGHTFIGIRVGEKRILSCNIFFPYDGQFSMPIRTIRIPDVCLLPQVKSPRKKRGPKVIPVEASLLLNESLSLREKARLTGLSHEVIRRRIKELRANYVPAKA